MRLPRSPRFVAAFVFAAALAASPLVVINLTAMVCGRTVFNPFTTRRLESRLEALRLYAVHRKRCLFHGHPPLRPLAAKAERRHGLPAGLLQALIQIESESNPHRISWAGAMGPGQLMPTTARMLGVADPYDPATAIDASGRYLAEQLKRFKSIELAMSAYNAGPGAVRGAIPRNGETEFYVAKIMAEYERRRASEKKP